MKMQNVLISIVSPVYKGENMTDELVRRTIDVLKNITDNYEIILVEDGSTNKSWEVILKNAKEHRQVKGILLSRNHGQHAAIYAGLNYAKGEWIVVMDCDLQDRPEEIPQLLNKALEGYHVVLAKRIERNDSFIKRIFSKFFYMCLGYLTDTKQDASVANFGVYHRKVINSILTMQDKYKYFPTMVNWVGFRQTKLEVQHDLRFAGKSSYSFKKLLNLGLNVILTFSNKPLKIVLKLGLLVSFSAILLAVVFLIKYYRGEIKVMGWASTVLSIWFFSGMIIFVLGIVGLYIGRIFEQTKDRAVFIVQEEVNTKS